MRNGSTHVVAVAALVVSLLAPPSRAGAHDSATKESELLAESDPAIEESELAAESDPVIARDEGPGAKVEDSLDRAGEATHRGLERGAQPVGSGLERAMKATGRGLRIGIEKTGEAFRHVGDVLTGRR